MKEQRSKRKFTAILSADVKGYSLLMADDEGATVRAISVYREVMTDLIKDHRGQVVDAKGDNVLAEFQSVVDAFHPAMQVKLLAIEGQPRTSPRATDSFDAYMNQLQTTRPIIRSNKVDMDCNLADKVSHDGPAIYFLT